MKVYLLNFIKECENIKDIVGNEAGDVVDLIESLRDTLNNIKTIKGLSDLTLLHTITKTKYSNIINDWDLEFYMYEIGSLVYVPITENYRECMYKEIIEMMISSLSGIKKEHLKRNQTIYTWNNFISSLILTRTYYENSIIEHSRNLLGMCYM